jgi:hypothetical protein
MSFLNPTNLFGGGGSPTGSTLSNQGTLSNTFGNTNTNTATGTTNPYAVSNNPYIAGLIQQLLQTDYPTTTGGGAGAGQTSSIINDLMNYGTIAATGGANQYQAGLAGQLTPAQQALTDFTAGQNRTSTANTYADLGLGGSSMATEDQNANNLASLTQQEQIDFQNEQAGLTALGTGTGIINQAGGLNLNQQSLANQLYEQLLSQLINPQTGSSGSTSTTSSSTSSGIGGSGSTNLSNLIPGNTTGTGSGITNLAGGTGSANQTDPFAGGPVLGTGNQYLGVPGGGTNLGSDLGGTTGAGSGNIASIVPSGNYQF